MIIAILLSLSPMLILLEHHNSIDILDKLILVSTAFVFVLANLLFQNKCQSKSFSILKLVLYTLLFNIILFGINLCIRVPFWNMIPKNKPPLIFLGAVDFVRSIIIALISFWIISFFEKNNRQNALRIKLAELENQTLQLQLNNLTAQLQPHFFFNSLNVLAELIYVDTQKSDFYIQHLSNIFRYVLINKDSPIIPLSEELNFIKSYLYLLNIRHENHIEIQYRIEHTENFVIASL
ncbi:MAG: histidine kinase, partial [Chitinophagaceae bacterium]